MIAALLFLPAAAGAQSQILGSSLPAAPNWGAGCEIELDFFDPEPTARGEYSARLTNKDCTWFQPLSVPGNGRITSISVRAGTGPTRIRFVVARSLQGQGGPAGGGCCFFVAEFPPAPQPPLTLTPNVVNTIPVDIPVERNASQQTGIISADFIGFSAEPNTGELPLLDTDPGANSTLSGPATAGFYYPRLGALPSDANSSRNPKGIPGVDVLLQATFVPAGTPGGGTGGVNPPPINPGGGPQQTPVAPPGRAPALRGTALRVTGGQAVVDLICQGNVACEGQLELLSPGAKAARNKVVSYGKASYSIPAGGKAKRKVALNAKGKKLLRTKRKVKLVLRLTPANGGPAITSRVTLTTSAKKR